jgi:signal transduction histidine kinase
VNSRSPVPPTGRTVLVVDDQPDTLISLRLLLERQGHRVLAAQTGTDALRILEQEPVQLLLVDHRMPEMDGEELIARVRPRDALIQIVLITGHGGDSPRELLARLPIQGYHDKADGPERLLQWVDVALGAYDQLAQLHIAERLKTELLANVSHEFRTPLNIIVGYVELLREGTFGTCPEETQPVFGKVLGNAAYLLDLVEEFLNFAKLEAGALAADPEDVPLTPFLRELGDSFALLVRGKPVEFVTEVPGDLPVIPVDRAKLRVVIQNLLSNAAKFTAHGRIRLGAELLNDGRVAVHVSDTGPGIPVEHQQSVFDIFHQLSPHDQETKGIGLGLALARRYARMMGGDVTLESTVGVGSTFTVVLPSRRRPNEERECAA